MVHFCSIDFLPNWDMLEKMMEKWWIIWGTYGRNDGTYGVSNQFLVRKTSAIRALRFPCCQSSLEKLLPSWHLAGYLWSLFGLHDHRPCWDVENSGSLRASQTTWEHSQREHRPYSCWFATLTHVLVEFSVQLLEKHFVVTSSRYFFGQCHLEASVKCNQTQLL